MKAILVTTKHRGVFVGYVPTDTDLSQVSLRLEKIRMYVRWRHGKGLPGCATLAPSSNCLISAEAPAAQINDITSVFDINETAETALWPAQ